MSTPAVPLKQTGDGTDDDRDDEPSLAPLPSVATSKEKESRRAAAAAAAAERDNPSGPPTDSTRALPASAKDVRLALLPFFVCYAPHRLPEIPKLVEQHVDKGMSLQAVVAACKSEFFMVPTDTEVEMTIRKDLRTRLYCFYTYYNWEMLPEVERLARKYEGSKTELELWAELEAKYGPEVPPFKLVDGTSPAERLHATAVAENNARVTFKLGSMRKLLDAVLAETYAAEEQEFANEEQERQERALKASVQSGRDSWELYRRVERDDPSDVRAMLIRSGIDLSASWSNRVRTATDTSSSTNGVGIGAGAALNSTPARRHVVIEDRDFSLL